MTTFRSRWIMLAMLLFGCGVDMGGGEPCVASSSAVERDACHAALAASADSALERYFALAMEQAAAPAELQAAQVAWEGYVDLHCHAIYENYAEAPMRSSLFTMCRWNWRAPERRNSGEATWTRAKWTFLRRRGRSRRRAAAGSGRQRPAAAGSPRSSTFGSSSQDPGTRRTAHHCTAPGFWLPPPALQLSPGSPDVLDDFPVMPVMNIDKREPLPRGEAPQHGVAPNSGIASKARQLGL